MKYRKLGKLNVNLSALGFGAMRLPVLDDDKSNIDKPLAEQMITNAIKNGVNYIDTAYPYHGGKSEEFVGEVLEKGYREKVYLATKMPIWQVNKKEDLEEIFNTQLRRLKTNKIDFYLLHNLYKNAWNKLKNLDIFEWAETKKRQGKINYFGFSFHDSYPFFEKVLDSYNWDFCQIQYNYVNEEMQAGRKGLEYAYSKNIPVIVMEPLLGGALTEFPPEIENNWKNTGKAHVQTAFQWLWDQKPVGTILSGMNSKQEVDENIKYADLSEVVPLSETDYGNINLVKKKFEQIMPIVCTGCGYCLPCPQEINIPRLFKLYNYLCAYKGNQKTLNRVIYNTVIETNKQGNACIQCKKCEENCPQSINITSWLKKVHEALYDSGLNLENRDK